MEFGVKLKFFCFLLWGANHSSLKLTRWTNIEVSKYLLKIYNYGLLALVYLKIANIMSNLTHVKAFSILTNYQQGLQVINH